MGRKQGQPPSAKATKAKAKKPAEQGRAGKRPLPRNVMASSSKQLLPRSVAGFSLYSSDSEPDNELKEKPVISRDSGLPTSPRKPAHSKIRAEKQPVEIKSQMQLQKERMMADDSSGILIPTGDFEGLDDKIHFETNELPEVLTPFNKRLISSTPDPERLLEAELQEAQQLSVSQAFGSSHPAEIFPQMIPEKDTVDPVNAPALLATVASSLSEKLRQQRLLTQQQEYQKQIQGTQQVPHHIQHLSNPQQQKLHPNRHQNVGNLSIKQNSKVIFSKVSQDVLPLPITKAEWVEDFLEQHSNRAEMVMVSSRSDRSASGLTNSAEYQVLHGVTTSEVTPDSHSISAFRNSQADSLNSVNLAAGQAPYLEHTVSTPEMSHLEAVSNKLQSQVKHMKVPHENFETSKPVIGKNTSKLNSFNVSNMPGKSDGTSVATSSNSKLEKTEKEFSKSKKSAFISNPSAGNKDHHLPPSERPSKESKGSAGPNSCDEKISKQSGATVNMSNLRRKVASHKDGRGVPSNGKVMPGKDKKKISQKIDERGEDVPPTMEIQDPVKPFKEIPSVMSAPSASIKSFPNVDLLKIPTSQSLDSSADTCDIEVSNVISDSNNRVRGDKDVSDSGNMPEAETESDRESIQSDRSTGLSQVIELLKTGAFNQVPDLTVDDGQARDKVEKHTEDMKFEKFIDSPEVENRVEKEERTSTLEEMMSQYLPKQDVNVTNTNNNNSRREEEDATELNDGIKPDGIKSDAEVEEKGDAEGDVNQNYNSRYDRSGNSGLRQPENLRYLEQMADPRLRDIACRLAFKATALRDPELRDLIDDMIFHTDAALSHEDARFQSSQMFFAEENGKLKKRVQNINRQLEAKERQERMGGNALGISNNDVLHLERKIMYLRQEKDKLDSQVTTLLEEKGRWLITQQDLVKTISLKDHEILKLEEKHHEEMKTLHQSLDQATKNSQGVHYKLSVADREISNLEQRIKTKDLEIGELKDKILEVEKKHRGCEARSLEKDKEMGRLQDLVDTLKIGVDHVLQAYEASTSTHSATDGQRQGIENLRQMVQPEEYSLSGSTPSDSWQRKSGRDEMAGKRQDHHYSQATVSSKGKAGGKQLLRPRPQYPSFDRPTQLKQRSRQSRESKEEPGFPQRVRSLSQENRNEDTRRLTPQVLEEHNRLLSPVDHSLWRSLDDGPVMPPVAGEEPYFSDSEIEVNHRDSRRRSSRRYENDNLRNFPEKRVQNGSFYLTKNGRNRLSHGKYHSTLKQGESIKHHGYDHTLPKTSYRKDESGRPRQSYAEEQLNRRDRVRKDSSGRSSGQERDQVINRSSKINNNEELESVPIEPGDDDGDEESRYSVTDYFREYSSMPPTRLSPRRNQRSSFENSNPLRDETMQDAARTSQTTKFSTLRSAALSGSNGTEGQSRSTDTKYSTLRSKTLSKSHDSSEQWDEAHLAHDKDFPSLRSKSLTEEGTTERDPQRSTRHIRSFTEQPPQRHHQSHSPVADNDRRGSSPVPDTLEYKSLSSSDEHQDNPQSVDDQTHEHWQSTNQRHESQLSPRSLFQRQHERQYFEDSRTFPEHDSHFTTLRPHHLSGSSHVSRKSSRSGDHDPDHSFTGHETADKSHDFHQHHDRLHHSGHQTFPHQYGHHSGHEHEPHVYRDTQNRTLSPRGSPNQQRYKSTDNGRPSVTFQNDHFDESIRHPSYSIQSDFINGRSSLPTQSSPIHISDVSVSRRATRGTDDQNLTQKEFFQGTELSASLSSISDNGAGSSSSFNNNQLHSLDEDPFSSGIASLDAKIMALQKKIDRTKAIFS